jgi:hypothetical protein
MLRDWIPANGRQSHCVLFGSDGPTIRTGNRGRPKGDYMLVTNRGPNDVYVRFPATPEQRTAFQERRKQESAAKQREDVRSQVTVAGITHEQSRDGTWKRWTGERVKLVEMEVCREDQFPEGRKRHKYGDVWVVRRLPGGMFEYCVRTPRDEAKPMRGPEFDSADAWRKKLAGYSGVHLDIIALDVSGEMERRMYGEPTYRYDDETLERVAEAIAELREAISSGRIVKTKRDTGSVKQARADVDLQAFLAGIVSTTGGPVCKHMPD